MKRLACMASVLAVMVLSIGAADEKTPSIKDVMNKLHKGAKAPLAVIKTQLKSETTDWKAVQDASKDFVILGASLAKNAPPKGDKTNYVALADAYFESSKALDDAAKTEDKAKTKAAFGKIGASCKDCHAAHKGK